MCYMIPFIYISGQGRALGQERKICQQMFLAALFIITKTWKQLKCPSVGEWRNKLWYLQTMGYYSELKINELSRHGWILNVHYKWKKATWKEIWKKQNYGDSKKSVVPGCYEGEWWVSRAQETLRTVNIL